MLLSNVRLINGNEPVNIAVDGSIITKTETGISPIRFTDAIAFPGLINSHDHLDFNCFSPFGKKKYNNYTEWGAHIHEEYKDEITAVLNIPQELRILWGIYKNLLSGVTTVINHGGHLEINDPPINVPQKTQNLHSVKFEKNWKWKLNNPLHKNEICVIHTGEGLDKQSHDEIDTLIKFNLLNRKLVGVHGVAMTGSQAKKFRGLVWCPESNEVLLDRQANIARLKTNTRVVFGTDSTLTSSWDIWQHLRLARQTGQVTDEELFNMITHSPAKLWGLNNGALTPGKDADIVIAKTLNGNSTWDDFFAITPQDILMILHHGNIRMFDESLLPQLSDLHIVLSRFSTILINGVAKFVEGDPASLIHEIRSYHPGINFPVDICEPVKSNSNDQCY